MERPPFLRVVRSPAPGIVPAYWPGEINQCPGCSQAQWLVGRTLAECAMCGTALPLARVPLRG